MMCNSIQDAAALKDAKSFCKEKFRRPASEEKRRKRPQAILPTKSQIVTTRFNACKMLGHKRHTFSKQLLVFSEFPGNISAKLLILELNTSGPLYEEHVEDRDVQFTVTVDDNQSTHFESSIQPIVRTLRQHIISSEEDCSDSHASTFARDGRDGNYKDPPAVADELNYTTFLYPIDQIDISLPSLRKLTRGVNCRYARNAAGHLFFQQSFVSCRRWDTNAFFR